MTRTPSAEPAPSPLCGSALRESRRDLALDVVRLGCSLATVIGTYGVPRLHDVAVAHLALAAVAAAAVLAGLRPGRTLLDAGPSRGSVLTWGTLAFWLGSTVLWHDVPGAGSALGPLVLLEAGIRYGLPGAAVSGSVVTATALLLPQVDATGSVPSTWTTLLLVALLLPAAVWLRAGTERAASRAEQVESAVSDALSALPVGVVVLRADGVPLHANASLDRLLPRGEALPQLRALAAASGQEPALETLLAGHATDRLQLNDGAAILSVGASRTRDGHVVVHVEDVTRAAVERDHLRRLADVDALTGVTSRAAGERALAEARGRLALLFVDLDGVKGLNDRDGHAVGDAVLAHTGARLRGLLRDGDLAVRWGGDEFVLLVRVSDPAEGHTVAQRVVAAVREPVRLHDGRLVEVTASVGLAQTTDGTEGLVESADAAMYGAKRAGGDRVCVAPSPVAV
ncbi:MAG: diguanylate cyclase with sensor [Frankiales bacterium]|nr:diguanylate cyclase with sensor [Frankiales bacterium]